MEREFIEGFKERLEEHQGFVNDPELRDALLALHRESLFTDASDLVTEKGRNHVIHYFCTNARLIFARRAEVDKAVHSEWKPEWAKATHEKDYVTVLDLYFNELGERNFIRQRSTISMMRNAYMPMVIL